jgi:hypothetical protein
MPFMSILRFARLIWTFYKGYFLFSALITICCIILFWEYGFKIFNELFWLKIGTLAISFVFINNYKKKEYHYYLNLGISRLMLWLLSLSFDIILFVILILLTYKLK